MEPQIQYAQTSDGVSIAYWAMGKGMPLVFMPTMPFNHVQLEWQTEARNLWESLVQRRMLVRYDGRGTGLSDRDVTDYSLDALMPDLAAVVDSLSLERFALFGPVYSGALAIAYAARNPDRVSHLLLWNAWDKSPGVSQSQLLGLNELQEQNWELYTQTVAHALLGWSEGESAQTFAKLMRECVTPEAARAIGDTPRAVTDLLDEVTVPTLVLHRQQAPIPDLSVAKRLASRIPNARLALLEGTSLPPWMGDLEPLLAAIDEFLGEGEETQGVGQQAGPSGMVTILFTDIEDSTAIRQRLGDAEAQKLVHAHNSIVRDALKSYGGKEIKHTGDGIMASFVTASSALSCAVGIQRGVVDHVEADPGSPLGVYIGLNAGEPIAEDDDIFGTSVDLASRICGHAQAGQIVVSNVVRELAAGKDYLFSDLGEMELRGFEDPVRLYEVRWRE